MQGCELLTVLPFPLDTETPFLMQEEDDSAIVWTMYTPPLRVEADSMQHWLDLNA